MNINKRKHSIGDLLSAAPPWKRLGMITTVTKEFNYLGKKCNFYEVSWFDTDEVRVSKYEEQYISNFKWGLKMWLKKIM
jgi:hypothetical protein